jgi:arylsulfatase A-like enzyme
LPTALQVPAAPPSDLIFALAEAPAGPRTIIPFRPRPRWPFVARMQLHRGANGLPAVSFRELNAQETEALGSSPRALAGPAPGTELGPCLAGSERGEWVTCQRLESLDPANPGAAVVIDGEGVRDLKIFAAELPSPQAPENPLLAPLLMHVPMSMGHSAAYRDALAAFGGKSSYLFPLTLPAQGELRVGLGLKPSMPLEPARFVATLDGAVLFDQVVAEEGWRDLAVPLPDEPGRIARLELTAQPVSSAVTHGLWSNPRAIGKTQKPSIVLVTIDALRPDHLGFNGYARDTSPTLDKLAQAGVVFERATSQAAQTWPSVASFLSGRYPTRTGVLLFGTPLPLDLPLLPEMLGAAGYDTVAGSDLAAFPPSVLDRFDDERQALNASGGQRVMTQISRQLRQVAEEIALHPTFAWFHLENAHYPLEPAEPLRYDPGYAGRFEKIYSRADHNAFAESPSLTPRELVHLRALYDASIRDADSLVLDLMQALVANGVSEDTIVVIAADHGELIGEHGITLEHQTPYDGVLHVPLIVVWPKELAPRRVSQRVQLVDLVPTLLSLAGLPPQHGVDGRDLSPLLRGGTLPEAPAFAEVGENCRVQYRGDEKLIISPPGTTIQLFGARVPVPPEALFDVAGDPGEEHPLQGPRVVQARAALAAEVARERLDRPAPGTPVLGQAARDALANAGYLPAHP